jgi:hypothetical protein
MAVIQNLNVIPKEFQATFDAISRFCSKDQNLLLSITNKMQRYTIFFITVKALHVSGGFSAHHQELKNYTHSIGYVPGLLTATASMGELELTHASVSSKQAWHVPDAVCTVFELLMMGGKTSRNIYSFDNSKEYCIKLHLVGYT